jgi:hypothetical protein
VIVDQGVDVVVADARLVRTSGMLGGRAALRAPAAAWGDPAKFLDVQVDQFPRAASLVAAGGLAGRPDDRAGQRSQAARWGTWWRCRMAPTVRAARPSSAPIQAAPLPGRLTQFEDPGLEFDRRLPRRPMRLR